MEEWVEQPVPQPPQLRKARARITYVFARLETAGVLAGDQFIKKLNISGAPPLWEVKIDLGNLGARIFGTVSAGRLYLTTVRIKKKQALSTKEYSQIQMQVRAHLDRMTAGDC